MKYLMMITLLLSGSAFANDVYQKTAECKADDGSGSVSIFANASNHDDTNVLLQMSTNGKTPDIILNAHMQVVDGKIVFNSTQLTATGAVNITLSIDSTTLRGNLGSGADQVPVTCKELD